MYSTHAGKREIVKGNSVGRGRGIYGSGITKVREHVYSRAKERERRKKIELVDELVHYTTCGFNCRFDISMLATSYGSFLLITYLRIPMI